MSTKFMISVSSISTYIIYEQNLPIKLLGKVILLTYFLPTSLHGLTALKAWHAKLRVQPAGQGMGGSALCVALSFFSYKPLLNTDRVLACFQVFAYTEFL